MFLGLLLILVAESVAQDVVNASNYGVQPDSTLNAAAGIRKAIATCKAKKAQPCCSQVAASISGLKGLRGVNCTFPIVLKMMRFLK